MTKIKTGPMSWALGALAAGMLTLSATVAAAAAEGEKPAAGGGERPGEEHQIHRQKWTYGGLIGYFDEQQLRRGYKVYKEVCSNCHNMRLLSYRNLGEPGGPHFPAEVVKAIAAEVQVADGYDDQGNPAMRAGKPSDSFQGKFKNDKEAAAAFGGAVPPDLSLITKARTVEREFAWYVFPYIMLKDLFTQYQEQGSDYVYALLTGYKDAPAGFNLGPGLNYNVAFPGHQLAMPQPLTDGAVTFEDGSPNDLDHEARDVTAYLAWAAEPHLVERKKLGLWVLVYLGVLSVLLLIAKKTLWRNVEH
jgi:ubiquinol-cytochrome c reductase cytochrome c1 subunit